YAGQPNHYNYSPPLTRWRYISLACVCLCVLLGMATLPLLIEPANMYASFLRNVIRPVWGATNNAVAQAGVATGGWQTTFVSVSVAGMFSVALSFLTMVAVSIPAWLYGRSYCNSICPIGTMLGFVSRQAIWRIDIDTDLCINCGRCSDVCKASCVDLGDHVIDGSRCVNCFDCLTVCPNDAIHYRRSRKQLSLPMLQPTRQRKPGVATSMSMAVPISSTTKQNNDNETISGSSKPSSDRRY
ncbi:MAG: 4Fe-4S binding protein, partial [Muribaculum sp.]|nr:4Fe-4S binding protein [Muribaculum sp.]